MSKKKVLLYKLILTALFTALTFGLTFINIPIPLGGIIHLGNFIAILAALLTTPLIGGIAGGVGMGLFDLVSGYPPTTTIRSFILKFVVCFLAGLIFKKSKNFKNTTLVFTLSAYLFLLVGILTLIPVITNDGHFNFTIDKAYTMSISVLIPILAFAFAIGLYSLIFIAKKLNDIAKGAIIATTFAIIINVVLEFILRTILVGFTSGSFAASFATAVMKIPSSLITAMITIIFIALIYPPLYIATKNLFILNEIKKDKTSENEIK